MSESVALWEWGSDRLVVLTASGGIHRHDAAAATAAQVPALGFLLVDFATRYELSLVEKPDGTTWVRARLRESSDAFYRTLRISLDGASRSQRIYVSGHMSQGSRSVPVTHRFELHWDTAEAVDLPLSDACFAMRGTGERSADVDEQCPTKGHSRIVPPRRDDGR
jgi:hypothetical protein